MPKILLADDSAHAQRMGTKILASEGIEVITVSNGEAAVKRLADGDVDLVLADVYMPGLDGYEVCQWVKKSDALAGLPVVLVVGALEPYDPDKISQVNADGLLRKPFEASLMLDTVRPLLEAAARARATRVSVEADYDKTVAIPPPIASRLTHDNKHEETVEILPPEQPHVEAVPAPEMPFPTHEPAPLPLVEEDSHMPLFVEEEVAPPPPPPPAPAHPEFPPASSASAFEAPEEMSIPQMQHDEASVAEFTIPEIAMDEDATAILPPQHHEEPAPPPPAPEPPAPEPPAPEQRWVATPVPVAPADHARFGESGGAAVAPAQEWGDLLKSVEEASPRPTASTTPDDLPGLEPMAAKLPAASPTASTTDLELELPVEPPEPEPEPAAPQQVVEILDEDELRMAVQLCLENALPGLVDEITSAVLRRLGRHES